MVGRLPATVLIGCTGTLQERRLSNGERGLVALLQFYGNHTAVAVDTVMGTPIYEVLVGTLAEGGENDVALN